MPSLRFRPEQAVASSGRLDVGWERARRDDMNSGAGQPSADMAGRIRKVRIISVLFWLAWASTSVASIAALTAWAVGSREAALAVVRGEVARVAGQGAAHVASVVGLVDDVLARLSEGTSEADLDGLDLDRLCPSLVCANYGRSPRDLLIAFARSNGDVVIANASPAASNLAGRDYFAALRAADIGLAVGKPRTNNVVEGLYLPMGRRLVPEAVTFQGIVAAAINVDLIRVFFQGLGTEAVDRIDLRDKDGATILSWPAAPDADGAAGCGPTDRAPSDLAASEPLRIGGLSVDACRTVRSALAAWRGRVFAAAGGALLLLLVPAAAFPILRRRWEKRVRQQLGLSGLVAGSSDVQFIVAARSDGAFVLEALTFTQVGGVAPMSARLIGRTTRELFPADQADLVDADYRDVLASGETRRIERRITLGGTQFVWSTLLVPLREAGRGYIYGAANTLADDPSLARGLRGFTEDVLRREDNERRRIARELHDTTGQNLIAAGFELGAVARGLADAAPQVRAALSQARELVDASVAELRTLSYVLYPPLLDEAGLGTALTMLAEGFGKRAGLCVTVSVDEALVGRRWAPEIELALYRVAQESLTNVQRHSPAKAARVEFRTGVSGQLELSVANDVGEAADAGKGPVTITEGAGIRGMRDRLETLGGKLTAARREGGFRIVATLPGAPVSGAS